MTIDGEDRDDYPEDSSEDGEVSSGEVDRFPVSQLMGRYSLVKSAVYNRLNELEIKPEKIGNRAYVNAEQVKLLDELHHFIQRGGNTAEFLEMRGLRRPTANPNQPSSELSLGQPGLVQMVSSLAAELAIRLQPPAPEPNPLEYFERLERAAQGGWLLSTSEVAALLKLPVSELQLYGDRFSEAGFTFTRAGYRAGGEVAWRVSKPLK